MRIKGLIATLLLGLLALTGSAGYSIWK